MVIAISKLISSILRAFSTFKEATVINRLLLMYSWIEKPILNPTLDCVREMLNSLKWSRSNPPPRISIPPSVFEGSFKSFHPTEFYNSYPPTMTFSRIGSHVMYPRKYFVLKSFLKDGIRNTAIWFVRMSRISRSAGDRLPEKVISPAHSRTNSSPVIIVIVNSHLFGFRRLTF